MFPVMDDSKTALSREPRRRRKEARPSELVAAALDCFVEKGYAATRLDDVAARAGVSKGTLYLYFDSKEALFKAVIREGILPTLAEGEQMVAAHQGCAADLLRELLSAWWGMVGGTRLSGVFKLMVCEERNFPEVAEYYYEQVVERGRRLLTTAIERGIASGEFRPIDVDACINVGMAPIIMLAIWSHSPLSARDCALEPGRFLAAHFDLMRNGLVAADKRKE